MLYSALVRGGAKFESGELFRKALAGAMPAASSPTTKTTPNTNATQYDTQAKSDLKAEEAEREKSEAEGIKIEGVKDYLMSLETVQWENFCLR